MTIGIDYFDNNIELTNEFITVIEVENKKYFYRLAKDFIYFCNNDLCDSITFFEEINEINMKNKIKVFIDYFNLFADTKSYTTNINNYIIQNISDEDKNLVTTIYNRLIKSYKKVLNDIDIPLILDDNITIEKIIKFLKVKINHKEDLLDNLLLLIDLEKIFKTDNLLVFINLKQYLTVVELEEFYKYAIYNNIKIVLIDSQSYKNKIKFEKKILIDEDLDEFMIN